MAEEVTHDLDPGARLEAEVNPVWRWPKKWSGDGTEGKMLALRHPGLGWLAFVFPEKEAQRIAEYLLAER